MIKNKWDFRRNFTSGEYIEGKDAEGLLDESWLERDLHRAAAGDAVRQTCKILEFILIENAVLKSKVNALGELSGMLIELLKENPKPSWVVHPNPKIRELMQCSHEELQGKLSIEYGIQQPGDF